MTTFARPSELSLGESLIFPPGNCCLTFPLCIFHRWRIKTEEKAKVVVSVWGKECIQFLAAQAVLPRTIVNIRIHCTRMIWKKRMNSSYSSKLSKGKIASAARNWKNSSPQAEATTFVFSSVFILLLWHLFSYPGPEPVFSVFFQTACKVRRSADTWFKKNLFYVILIIAI